MQQQSQHFLLPLSKPFIKNHLHLSPSFFISLSHLFHCTALSRISFHCLYRVNAFHFYWSVEKQSVQSGTHFGDYYAVFDYLVNLELNSTLIPCNHRSLFTSTFESELQFASSKWVPLNIRLELQFNHSQVRRRRC